MKLVWEIPEGHSRYRLTYEGTKIVVWADEIDVLTMGVSLFNLADHTKEPRYAGFLPKEL